MANGAYSFDGTDDGLQYSHISTFDGLTKVAISLWIWPIASSGFDHILGAIGANGGGAGNTNGIALLHNGSDETSIFAAYRNNSGDGGSIASVFTSGAWNHLLVNYDGTQGTVGDRVIILVNGVDIGFTAGGPSSLGTNDQPLTLAWGEGGFFNQCKLADVGILFGRLVDGTTAAALAGGASIGNYVAAGDFWASFRVNANDENGGRTATLIDAPTLTTGPSLTYPGGGGGGGNPWHYYAQQ